MSEIERLATWLESRGYTVGGDRVRWIVGTRGSWISQWAVNADGLACVHGRHLGDPVLSEFRRETNGNDD